MPLPAAARSDELDAELHVAELAFADHLTHSALVGVPTTYEALAELWDSKGIEFQRLLVEAVLEPITVKPAAVPGRKRFDQERLTIVLRAEWRPARHGAEDQWRREPTLFGH